MSDPTQQPDPLPPGLAGSRRVFTGVRFHVHQAAVPGRDGKEHLKQIVVHPGAVVILPLLDERQVVMIRNQRVAVGRELWELPAGTLEAGEDPAACAARELIEETGYRAAQVRPLTEFFTSPGICTERMIAFLALDLQHVGQALEASEHITVQIVELARTLDMIRQGEICDGKTLAALLYYHTFIRG